VVGAALQAMLDYIDIIRIDHFRGFQAYWAVRRGETTANGEWIEAPGEALFQVLNQKLGKLPVLAEDLGVITPEVEALWTNLNFTGRFCSLPLVQIPNLICPSITQLCSLYWHPR